MQQYCILNLESKIKYKFHIHHIFKSLLKSKIFVFKVKYKVGQKYCRHYNQKIGKCKHSFLKKKRIFILRIYWRLHFYFWPFSLHSVFKDIYRCDLIPCNYAMLSWPLLHVRRKLGIGFRTIQISGQVHIPFKFMLFLFVPSSLFTIFFSTLCPFFFIPIWQA